MDKGDALIAAVRHEDIQKALEYIRQERGEDAMAQTVVRLSKRMDILEQHFGDMKSKAEDGIDILEEDHDEEEPEVSPTSLSE